MKFAEFKERIEKLYHDKFDLSAINCHIYRCLGKSIVIDCWLAKSIAECPNEIAGNDMFHISLAIELPRTWNDDDDLPETMTMKAWANDIKIKPENPMLYCDRRAITYRKVTGTAEKMISTFGKFVDRLYSAVKEEYNNNNLLAHDMELIKSKKYFT